MQTSRICFQQSSQPPINFKSDIKFVTDCRYERATAGIFKRKTDRPDMPNNILFARLAQKKDILWNVAGGITDGTRVVIFNYDPFKVAFEQIQAALLEGIKVLEPVKRQGLLIGAHKSSEPSMVLFNALQEFMSKYKIPCSRFKGHMQYQGASSIAYFGGNRDEWLITNPNLSFFDVKEGVKAIKKRLPSIFYEYKLVDDKLVPDTI